jgi:hypothetical protein
MKLTPVINISRFLSIDGATIVRISRYRIALDGYYDPPVVKGEKVVWGTSLEMRDTFQEIGQLHDVLKTIAPQEMVAAAAMASPKQFAEMVAEAHNLGRVYYIASTAMWVTDIPNAIRFCSIDVNKEALNFHVLVLPDLFDEQCETPGVYSVSFSLSEFVVNSRILVEAYPKHS